MTGAPAETWRKFRFATPPAWAYALYVLVLCGGVGLFFGAILMAAVAMRASGYLPLTRGSNRLVALAAWIPVALIVSSVGLWIAVAVGAAAHVDESDPNAGAVGGSVLLLGALLLVVGLIGRLVVTPLACPRGRITMLPGYPDMLVEIRNVHPAFVAALNQVHRVRTLESVQPAAQSPLQPGSN